MIRWRPTDAADWLNSVRVHPQNGLQVVAAGEGKTGNLHRFVLKGVRVDDWVFGVASVSKEGTESPVASAVPGGAFRPYTPPPATK